MKNENNEKPLSYFTNRLSIVIIILFYAISCIVIFSKEDHRAVIISLLIATGGAILLLIITITSPNKQIEWINKLLEKRQGQPPL